jgi:hypothetical protein
MDWSGQSAATRCTASIQPNGKEVVSIAFGGYANHFPSPSVGDGLLLLPGTETLAPGWLSLT